MFRQKEYSPVGPKADPLDKDPRFAETDFDTIYGSCKSFFELKNRLWTGVHESECLAWRDGHGVNIGLKFGERDV